MIEERKKQLAAKSEEKKKRSGAAAEQFGCSVRGMLCGLAGSLKKAMAGLDIGCGLEKKRQLKKRLGWALM
ncbi:hypothetical protein F0562_030802 [Nyssa sinensis]|uniref:Uncharacterized protein n=1 Tax=Nyssa sinensis TaxID=561372 RepID=A0A5J5B1Y2_9ASTE|nr:hypothetical protein F0562_030802 [Nyssa sinensis]